ncbi:M23 family metallopeptidase [Billgrantia azerbaijanica]|nr:M23 family metallopeptidase [Halomonas azerbaijanica]
MTRRWLLAGLIGLGPLLAEANWRERWLSPPIGPGADETRLADREESSSTQWVVQPPDITTTAITVTQGDTLDRLLRRLGLETATRAEVTTALAGEFDPRKLRPGYRLRLTSLVIGQPVSVAIERESGVQHVVTLGQQPTARTVHPRTDTLALAREVEIGTSVSASLAAEEIPTRFAEDLKTLLAGIFNISRDIRGSERLRLLWEEKRRQDGTRVGPPRLTYAGFDGREGRLEVVWPPNQADAVMIFQNGELLRSLRFPVEGARLTSSFGNRRHPVYGDIRRHDGIDLAAPSGTPVVATGSGRVAYIGWRGGYGRVVEIGHDSGAVSRYTHLSEFAEGLEVGDWVKAGDNLGAVGATGLATGPNLHYEIRLDDRPIDPLAEGQRIVLREDSPGGNGSSALVEARTRLAGVMEASPSPELAALASP